MRSERQRDRALVRSGNGATVVEPADENRTDDPFRALGCEPCGEIRARVLAEEDELVGIDTELRRVTADEAQGGAHIRERSRRSVPTPPSR